MESNNRRSASNYQRLLGQLEDTGQERELLEVSYEGSMSVNEPRVIDDRVSWGERVRARRIHARADCTLEKGRESKA